MRELLLGAAAGATLALLASRLLEAAAAHKAAGPEADVRLWLEAAVEV